MLDTNICIYVINERPKTTITMFRRHEPDDIGLSSITVSELAFGVAKSKSIKNKVALEAFLLPLELHAFDERAALMYGTVRAELERVGKRIESLDTLIAAHALSLGVPLVTNNYHEFRRVKGLKLENWI